MNRAFKVSFAPDTSKFVIEIQGYAGLYWKQARMPHSGSKKGSTLEFDTFSDAVDHVKKIGLDKVYADFTFQKPYGSPKVQEMHSSHLAYHDPQSKWSVPYIPQPQQEATR